MDVPQTGNNMVDSVTEFLIRALIGWQPEQIVNKLQGRILLQSDLKAHRISSIVSTLKVYKNMTMIIHGKT